MINQIPVVVSNVPSISRKETRSLRKSMESGVAISGAAAEIAAVVDASVKLNAKTYKRLPIVLPIMPAINTSKILFQLNFVFNLPRFPARKISTDAGAMSAIR